MTIVIWASAAVTAAAATPQNVRVSADDRAGSFVRSDGVADSVSAGCSTGRRPQAEPALAIDPSRPRVMVAGGQTLCPAFAMPVGYFDLGWAGHYRSVDGGLTWRASLVPGYPGDSSRDGRRSPLRGMRATAEHAMDFDRDGRLYYAFAACSKPKQSSCRHFVAVYDRHGARHRRTIALSTTTPPSGGPVENGFGHWTSVAVDRTGGRHDGNVYIAWDALVGFVEVAGAPEQKVPVSVPVIAHSTDGGATFSAPRPLMEPMGVPYSADLAVGPDGRVHAVVRNVGSHPSFEPASQALGGTHAIVLSQSLDGGVTWSPGILVDRIVAWDLVNFTSGTREDNPGVCGDGYFSCDGPFTAQDNRSNAVVAADESGVHVLYNARRPDGQSKVLVRSSPDGLRFAEPARSLDDVPAGHQDRVEVASDAGAITAIFMDSRADPAYSPVRPQGNTVDGTSPGPSVDLYAARSTDGGRTWIERRVSSVTTNPNLEIYDGARVGWNGDYPAIAATNGRVYAVWTDNRDVAAGTDSRTGGRDEGNDVHLPCAWAPADENVRHPDAPAYSDPCFSQGGLDQNLYGARLR